MRRVKRRADSDSLKALEALISCCGYARSTDVRQCHLGKRVDVCCPATRPAKVYKKRPHILLKKGKKEAESNLPNQSNPPKQTPKQLPNSARMPGSSDSDKLPITPLENNFRIRAVMPHPGQPGAPFFDNTNVTEFLRRWNIECEDYGLSDSQKCARLPDYCTPKTKDVIELLDGYKQSNWTKLQEELKGLFWQYDRQKDTPAALNELICDAPNTDLSIFILKYAAITDALVRGNEMSPIQRVRRLFDGLSVELRDKVFEFCSKKHWKLSAHNTGTADADFNELKRFILEKACLQ